MATSRIVGCFPRALSICQNWPASKEVVFQQKPFGKSRFHLLTDWTDNAPASQFWQMESGLTYPLNILVVCSGSSIRLPWYFRSIATTMVDLVGKVPTTDLTSATWVVKMSSSLGIRTNATKSSRPCTSPASSYKSYRNSTWLAVGACETKPKVLGCLAFWSFTILAHFATARYWSKQVKLENLLPKKKKKVHD